MASIGKVRVRTSAKGQPMRLSGFQLWSRITFTKYLQIAVGITLAAIMTACGGGSSSSSETSNPTGPTPPDCNSPAVASPVLRPATAHAAAATPQALSALSPAFFGMQVDVQALPGGNPPLPWPTFPFGTLRMMSTETRWSDIDKGDGNYDFTTLDQWRQIYASNEPSNGNYNIIFVLYSTPGYISSNPTDSCVFAGNTSGHSAGSCDPPADVCSDGTGTDASFTNFVTAVAQHVVQTNSLPQIKYWEVWNEPNDVTFWNGSL